ncbi:hypothetical protein TNCV_4416781 [Trichonephila clavipes]|uniref:Uncharacterized protein n=1 Tax=Trichonephila clavipes TaxID=2585209 RepID=A0A8X6V9R0_TRICX|nr:hypothetical protein TNCV_4416781 [Trichonephila clavipes]
MIPILKRYCDSFYMILVDDKTLPAFLTEYVFNCPARTSIEFQGFTLTDDEVEIEFYKFPKGFAYCHDVESEFYEKAVALMSKYYQEHPEDSEDEDGPRTVTPDVLLDILTTIFDPIVNMYKEGDCVHIRTSPPEDVGYPEEFSTVGYIEMKQTHTSSFEGKRVYRSLLDLPHLCDEYCNHTPPPDNEDLFSNNLWEEDSSEVSLDIALTNMKASLDTSDTKPLEDSSNRLVASKNGQMDKMEDVPSDNTASKNGQMDKEDVPSDNTASKNGQMDKRVDVPSDNTASKNGQMDKRVDVPSDNTASKNGQMDKRVDVPSDNTASKNGQMDKRVDVPSDNTASKNGHG